VTTTLDLMRHGEPVGGRRYRGQIDDPLSEKGWAQMQAAVGEKVPWTRVVSSPLLRVAAGLEDLLAQHAGQHVLLVGHAGVIRMAFAWALYIPLEHAYRIEVASAGLTRLRFDGSHARLIFHGGNLAQR